MNKFILPGVAANHIDDTCLDFGHDIDKDLLSENSTEKMRHDPYLLKEQKHSASAPAVLARINRQKTTLQDMPFELKKMIASHLSLSYLKNLRHVDKSFNAAASDVVQNIYLDNSGDLGRALKIYQGGGLRKITLEGDSFRDEDLQYLPESLREIVIRHCSKITHVGLEHLQNYRRLQTLTLHGIQIGDDGARVLAKNTNLTKISVEGGQIGIEGAIAFAKNETLKTLNLAGNQVLAKGAIALARNKTLTTLNLAGNKIQAEGASAFAQNITLTTLILDFNEIGYEGIRDLADNNSLKTLSLGSNEIDDAGASVLASNTTWTTLDLNFNKIGIEGAIALANSTLKHIKLKANVVPAATFAELLNRRR